MKRALGCQSAWQNVKAALICNVSVHAFLLFQQLIQLNDTGIPFENSTNMGPIKILIYGTRGYEFITMFPWHNKRKACIILF